MHTQTIIEIDIQGRPGALGGLARLLATQGINIEGFSVEQNMVRFLTKRHEEAVQRLLAAGFDAHPVTVIEIELENRPGALAQVATALNRADVHIVNTFGFGYGATGKIYVSVDEMEAASEALAPLNGVRIAA